ncbi:hypothetical protein GPECTOR_66g255 [Gonium pectorale]|uniref:C-terminal of Roc COR-B domain-containing protein n=1 Tax=Gonium pectorale TaxID=33097 RepID=A0A150G3U8_GONPE|nr:hypothetical protein GPECTOR_66g255 [Gonium pectorale]|eukprot:KXZ44527.1 hypothetical protein GPECTOR_66g255 [Gonium pectorale]
MHSGIRALSRERTDLPDGWTPLQIAAKNGHVEAIAALLHAGANKEVATKTGCTPLCIAAQNGHVEAIAALLQAGANKEVATKDGWTPLHIAAKNGHVEAIAALLQAGANKEVATKTGWTPLCMAAQNGHVEAIAALLQAGANKEVAPKDGWTPLQIAAKNGHVEAIAALLHAGANKEVATKTGWTPLYMAAQNGHVEAIAALLQAGANKEVATKDGWTPLHIAAKNGHVEAIAALLHAGANKEVATKTGWTPLYIAAQNGHVEAIAALLQAGANKEVATKGCWTPLHLACLDGDLARVEQLLQQGAPVDAAGKDGDTPLHNASQYGQTGVVEALLRAGAPLEVRNNDGLTPLHRACRRGHRDVVEALLRAGADHDAKTRDGKTPLDLARAAGFDGLADRLLQHDADMATSVRVAPRSKVVLVGPGAAGKTTLAHRLVHDEYKPDIPATDNMQVHEWTLNQPPTMLSIWDLGGQHGFRSTHAIFMSPEAVYITVYNSRDSGQAASVDAYLENVQTLAPGAINMVVGAWAEETVVIDLEWLADVLGDVVTRDKDKQKRLQPLDEGVSMPVGHVSKRRVHEAMEARCPGHANKLVRILEEYGLLYDLGDGEQRAIIPPTLPTLKADDIEKFLWEESPVPNEQPLRWWGAKYTFEKHLPDALLCRLLCRLLSLPELHGMGLEHMWRFGVFLQQGAQRIVVAYDPDQRPRAGPLRVITCGPEPELLGLLVSSQLAQLREQFPGVKLSSVKYDCPECLGSNDTRANLRDISAAAAWNQRGAEQCVECGELSDMSMYALDEQAVDWYPVQGGRQGGKPRGMAVSQGESEGTLKIRRSLGAMERLVEMARDMPDGTALTVELCKSLVRRAVALHKLVGPSGGEHLPLAVLLPAPDDNASNHRMELDLDSTTSGLSGSVRLHALCEYLGGLHLTDHGGYEVTEGIAWLQKHGRGLRPLLRALQLAGVSGPVGTLGAGDPEEEAMYGRHEMQRTHSRGRSGGRVTGWGEGGPAKQLDSMLACLDRLVEQADAQLRPPAVTGTPAAGGKGGIEGKPADLYSACQEACSSVVKIVQQGNMEAAAGGMPRLQRVVTRTAGAMWLCACHAEELGRMPLRSL